MTAARRWLALVALAMIVTGCGRGIDESATGVTAAPPTTTTTSTIPPDTAPPPEARGIVVWAPNRQVAAIRQAGDSFTNATGIMVTVEAVELEEMEQSIAGAVGPDLFMGSADWLGRLAASGLAIPIDLEPRRGEFLEVAADAFTYGQSMYGAPVTMESVAMYFNTSVVTTAPGAMSEIKDLCTQLRGGDAAPEDTTTTAADTTTTIAEPVGPGCAEFAATDAAVSMALVTAGDGYLYGTTAEGVDVADVGLATAATVARGETLRDLATAGVLSVSADSAAMVERFAAGETAILFGDLALAERISASGTPFGVAPLPIITGAIPRPFVEVVGFMASGRSTQPETALLFLNDYLITEPAMAALFAASAGLPAYGATAQQVAADTVVSGLVTAAQAGQPLPSVDGIEATLQELAAVLAQLFDVAGPEVGDVLEAAAAIAAA